MAEKKDEFSYKCPCGAKHELPAYAVAQMASGYTIDHVCPDCGGSNRLENFEIVEQTPAVEGKRCQ